MAFSYGDPQAGLAQGLNQGVQGFLSSYYQEKNRQDQKALEAQNQAMKQKMMALDVAKSGYMENPDEEDKEANPYVINPEAGAGILAQRAEAKQKLAESAADSDESKQLRDSAKAAIKMANPKMSDDQLNTLIPETMSGSQVRQHPLLKGIESGGFGTQGREQIAAMMGQRNDIQRQGLGLREDTQAQQAKAKITDDSNIKQLTTQTQAADRALNLLNKPGLTSQEFNDVQIEVSNMVAGARSSALGKLERTEYGKSLAQEGQDILAKLKGVPVESAPPELIDRLKKLTEEMKNTFETARYERAKTKSTKYKNNPEAESAQNEALNEYYEPLKSTYDQKKAAYDKQYGSQQQAQGGLIQPQGQGLMNPSASTAQTLSPEDQQAISWAQQNKTDPRAIKILQLHGMK